MTEEIGYGVLPGVDKYVQNLISSEDVYPCDELAIEVIEKISRIRRMRQSHGVEPVQVGYTGNGKCQETLSNALTNALRKKAISFKGRVLDVGFRDERYFSTIRDLGGQEIYGVEPDQESFKEVSGKAASNPQTSIIAELRTFRKVLTSSSMMLLFSIFH